MRRHRASHPVLGPLLGAIAVVLLGCSITSDSSIAPDSSPADDAASVATAEVAIDPDRQWVETFTTRSRGLAGQSIARAISPDGNWLAAGASEVCIYSLTDDAEPICISASTIGTDSLDWSADSSMVVTGGSTSGALNTTGVWTIATDGSGSSVIPVDERDEDGVMHVAMAFRPDGDSIVFSRWEDERVEIAEIGVDGSDRQVLLEIERGDIGLAPHIPLADGRVVVNTGVVDEPGVDLFDEGAVTRLFDGVEDDGFIIPPIAVAASTTSDEFDDGVALVVAWRTSRQGFENNSWWLVDFAGNAYPLLTRELENVVAATLSPDGNYVAYVTRDPLAPGGRVEVAFHVIEVSAVVNGLGPLGTHVVETDDPTVFNRVVGPEDSRYIRWTTDNRILIAPESSDVVSILEIDINASAR